MRSLRRISFSTKVQIATIAVAGTALAVVATCPACRGGESFFNQSCVQDWPQPVCALGNVMGLCSAALWFSCLIPQISLNYKRRSVDGLSFLWASANFIAAFVNLNFALPTQVLVDEESTRFGGKKKGAAKYEVNEPA